MLLQYYLSKNQIFDGVFGHFYKYLQLRQNTMANNKQISQAQHDYYQFREAKADRLANNYLKSCGLPLNCMHDPHVELYTKAKGMCNNEIIPKKDQKLLQKFCKTWLKHSGNLPQAQTQAISKKITHYGHKIKNQKNHIHLL